MVNLKKNEVKELKQEGIIVEKDICVKGSIYKSRFTKKSDEYKKNNYLWNVKSLGLETIKKTNKVKDTIKIAILDSGIDYNENINVVKRENFMNDDVSPLYEDNTGHGTAIAGIMLPPSQFDLCLG